MNNQPYLYDLAAKLARATEAAWVVPDFADPKTVTLSFRYTNGKISRVVVFSSSGIPAIDQSAMSAIYNAAEHLNEPGQVDCWFGLGTKEFVPNGRTKSGTQRTGIAPRVWFVPPQFLRLLDQNPTYTRYYSDGKPEMGTYANWVKKFLSRGLPALDNNEPAVISFVITADGKFKDIMVRKSSGNSTFDHTVSQFIANNKYEPLPEHGPRELEVEISFAHGPRLIRYQPIY